MNNGNKHIPQIVTLLTTVFSLFFFYSCKNQRIAREIEQLYMTKIEIPDNLIPKNNGKNLLPQLQEDNYATLIIWYDSVQCASCSIKYIEKWNKIFEYSEDSVKGFTPVIIFSPSKKRLYKFEASLKTTDFKYPIYVDYDFVFEKKNPQVSHSSQNVFLIDKNNEIVLVGNPFYNSQMWNLYKTTINTLIVNKGIIPVQVE